jgi:excisionase family DNA binding protein
MPAAQPDIEPLVLDVPEVARAMRVGVSSIRKMITEGKLKSIRVGDRVLVRRIDLEAFLADRAA